MNSDNQCRTEVDGLDRMEWSACLNLFDDASLYQTWDYANIVFPRQKASRLVLYRGRDVAAMAQLRMAVMPLLGRGMAYVAWGPMWRRKKAPRDAGILEAVLRAIEDEYVLKRRLAVRIAANMSADEESGAVDVLTRAGYTRIDQRPYRTMMLDITRPLEEIRAGLHQGWRRHLKKSQRGALEVRSGTSSTIYGQFLTSHDEMTKRKSFQTGVDAHRWALLQEALPEAEKPCVLIACHEGVAVAGMVFSRLGGTGVYLLGATSDAGLKLKGSYLLHWRAIEMMREAGCSKYDLGGIDPELNPGVYQFKAGLGGEEVSHVGVFERCRNRLSRGVVMGGEAFRSVKARFSRRRGS